MPPKIPLGAEAFLATNGASGPGSWTGGTILFHGDAWSVTDFAYVGKSATGIFDLLNDYIAFTCGAGGKNLWLSNNAGSDLEVMQDLAAAGHTLTDFDGGVNPASTAYDFLLLNHNLVGIPEKPGGASAAARKCEWLWDFANLPNKAMYVVGRSAGGNLAVLYAHVGLAAADSAAWTGHVPGDIFPTGFSAPIASVFDGVQPGGGMFCSDAATFSPSGSPDVGNVEVVATTSPTGGDFDTLALWRFDL